MKQYVIQIAPYFLKMQHRNTFSEGKTIQLINFSLIFNKDLEELRALIFKQVSNIAETDFTNFLHSYLSKIKINQYVDVDDYNAAILFDSKYILSYVQKMGFSNFISSKIVSDYLEFLSKIDLSNELINKIKMSIVTPIFNFYSKLKLSDRRKLRKSGFNHTQIHEENKKNIKNNFIGCDIETYKVYILYYCEICKYEDTIEVYEIRKAMTMVIKNLVEENVGMFLILLEYIFSLEIPFELDFRNIFNHFLIQAPEKHNDLFNLLLNITFNSKDLLIYNFFICLPEKLISNYYLEQALIMLPNMKFTWHHDFYYLNYFIKYDSTFLFDITKKIFKNRNYNHCSFKSLFDPPEEFKEEMMELLLEPDNQNFFQEIWLFELDDHYFCNCEDFFKIMIDNDPSFLLKHLDKLYSEDDYVSGNSSRFSYDYIWEIKNSYEIMDTIIDSLIQKNEYISDYNYTNLFFTSNNNEMIIKKRKKYLEYFITKYFDDIKMINVILVPIKKYFWDDYLFFLDLFLKFNNKFSDFRQLEIGFSMYSNDGGSFIPIYTQMLKLWNNILKRFDQILYIKHRQYAMKRIEYWEMRIENEEKSIFFDDFYL